MKPATSLVEAQLQALLDGVGADLEQRRHALLDEARAKARETLQRARRQALQQAREAVAGERREREASLERAGAALDSRIRRVRQSVDRELLSRGREALAAALRERWEDEAARREWLRLALREADARLLPGDWQLDHPLEVDAAWIREQLAAAGRADDIEAKPAGDLAAGFRLRHAGATLDLGMSGLLARPRELDGLLLAAFQRQREGEWQS